MRVLSLDNMARAISEHLTAHRSISHDHLISQQSIFTSDLPEKVHFCSQTLVATP